MNGIDIIDSKRRVDEWMIQEWINIHSLLRHTDAILTQGLKKSLRMRHIRILMIKQRDIYAMKKTSSAHMVPMC